MDWIPAWLRPIEAPPPIPSTFEHSDKGVSGSTAPALTRQGWQMHSAKGPLTLEEEDISDSTSGPLLAIPCTGFILGFGAGLYQAAKRSSLVFMAENAHRRPTTVQGWYFYNKTKNYKVLLSGITGGLKTGTRVGMWTLAYAGIEYGMTRAVQEYGKQRGDDNVPGGRTLAGGVAGLSIASGASLLYRLAGPIARRSLLLGLVAGGSVGALRDIQQVIAQQETA